MGYIKLNGQVYSYQGADQSNNVIKANNGKYYQKGADGVYHEIKQNGQSIFDTTKKKAQASIEYNKKSGFVPNKKYYVKGNSSYFTMVDKNYNTLYYKDNQQITKEQFLKGANCAYDVKSKQYVAKDATKTFHKYEERFRKKVEDSKTGRYYINLKGGARKYFEANGKEISERAFLDTENAYIDSDGQIAKYDWWAKTKKATKGIGNMFADMFTEKKYIYKKDKSGNVLLDRYGKPIPERNKDGSPKTERKFSLARTCTTILVGGAVAAVCILAAPVVATVATAVGIGASTAAAIGTTAGVATQLGIAGYFGYEGGKQMYEAEKENQNVLLSNNERMENWEKKGAGGAQVAMSAMMVKGSIKNAPKTHATARNTAKAIETKNNATLATKGKVGFRDKVANARAGFSETVGVKSMKNTGKNYHKNNSIKTKAADAVKTPLKVGTSVTKAAIEEPVKLVTDAAKTGYKLVTKKGRAELKGDINAWKNSFKENPQTPTAANLTPEEIIAQQESFNKKITNMPAEADARIQQYESLIENTTDKNQVGQLLDAIKNDKKITNSQRADIATKFFEKNDAQYPGVLENAKHQKAELALKKAKTLDDIAQIDREALSEKSQKKFDKKKTELEKKSNRQIASAIKDINKIKDPAKLDAKIEELAQDKFFDKVSETQANEVRNAIREKQMEIETPGIKEANENKVTNNEKQSLTARAKNWWNNRKTKSVINDINKIKDPAKLDAKIEELAQDKFFDKVSETQANEVRNAIREKQMEIETPGIKEANENKVTNNEKQSLTARAKNWWNNRKIKSVINDINKIKDPAKLDAKIEELAQDKFFDKISETQANEVRNAIREKQMEIETPGIKEANENIVNNKEQSVASKNETKQKNEPMSEKTLEVQQKAEIEQNTLDNTKSELHRITKNSNEPNNPNKIATKNSIGKLNSEKFEQVKKEFVKEVDNITSLEDSNIDVLRQRSEAFANRAQRRELQKILNDKLKKLESKTITEKITDTSKTEVSESKPTPVTEKHVETPKNKAVSESKVVEPENNFAKFDKMIEESTDMSKVRAKLSNNPEFDKLSSTEKSQLIGKINQREALLETSSAPKETPKASNKEYSTQNWFDNFKDLRTPTFGGLNAVKSVDENIIAPLEEFLNTQLDPNQQYVYAETPIGYEDEYMVESDETNGEEVVQEDTEQEEVINSEDIENNIETQEESAGDINTNENSEENVTSDNNSNNTTSQPEGDEQVTSTQSSETTAPATTTPETETPESETVATTAENKETVSTQNTVASDETQTNTSTKQEQTKTTTQLNNTNNTKNANTGAIQANSTKKSDKAIDNSTQEEPELEAMYKRDITQKVLNAKTEEEIADALQTLRDVGRFKGRKNLRRLLKAKRKNNQERIAKYEQKVKENKELANERFLRKLEDA